MEEIIEFAPAHLVIPGITDPRGKHWDQPKTTDFLISADFAKIKKQDIEKLLDYSNSQPSGTYIGKMWKTFDGEFWRLKWFGPHKDPGYLTVHTRKISIWL